MKPTAGLPERAAWNVRWEDPIFSIFISQMSMMRRSFSARKPMTGCGRTCCWRTFFPRRQPPFSGRMRTAGSSVPIRHFSNTTVLRMKMKSSEKMMKRWDGIRSRIPLKMMNSVSCATESALTACTGNAWPRVKTATSLPARAR